MSKTNKIPRNLQSECMNKSKQKFVMKFTFTIWMYKEIHTEIHNGIHIRIFFTSCFLWKTVFISFYQKHDALE